MIDFDALYGAAEDPWRLASEPYEQRKYDVTVASLPRQRYRSGLEPGCSVGVLTAMLAARCDALLACDVAATPLGRAAERVAGAGNVTLERRTVPEEWPPGVHDLVVLSELLYYLDAPRRASLLDRAVACLPADGHLVLVHWRHRFEEAACTGDEAHREARARPGLRPLVRHEERDFLLEVLGRAA